MRFLIFWIFSFFNIRKSIRFYLKKYRYVYDIAKKEVEVSSPEEKSNYVWTMWWQNDIPEICQLCLDSIKEKYNNVIVITKDNYTEYIDIPEYIMKKLDKGIISLSHFSDIIRTCLLDKYGGTWIDSTCLLTSEIPSFILNSDYFILKDFDKNNISSFFIHSNKNNYLNKVMKIFLFEYWKHENRTIQYFFFHNFFILSEKLDKKFNELSKKIPISLNQNVKIMYNVLFEDYNEEIFNWLKQTSYMHKLSYKHLYRYEKNENKEKTLYHYIIEKYRKKERI